MPASSQPIRAVVFDAYGTLFNVNSVVATCEALFPGNGKVLAQLWRSKQLEYSWLRSLMGRYVNFNQVTRESLQVACQTMGLKYADEGLAQLDNAYRTLALFDDALATLQLLRSQQPTLKLAILSNGSTEMLEAVVNFNQLDTMLDAVLSVDAVACFKPDPRVYELACDQLHVNRDEVAFVSSNGWDAAGAKSFGFKTFWINRTCAPVDALGVKPDQVLNTLAELPAMLSS